ncbi:leucine-rich repeat-containing protein sog2 [Moniliophthora roreri]|nr:leucine-rich repeat-containing protein sog2 [Moniliophthora roreri]
MSPIRQLKKSDTIILKPSLTSNDSVGPKHFVDAGIDQGSANTTLLHFPSLTNENVEDEDSVMDSSQSNHSGAGGQT